MNTEHIDFKDITIVVQGPVFGDPWDLPENRMTYQAIESARRSLPGARIVLSTWQGSNATGLNVDEIVQSADPGGLPLRMNGERVLVANNINRQIVSTMAGLNAVKTRYALKLRSDLILSDCSFLKYFKRYDVKDPDYSFLEARVLNPGYMARLAHNRNLYRPCCFHPSDWFFFGFTEDLKKIWDVPLMSQEDGFWFRNHPKPSEFKDHLGYICKFGPEVYLWASFIKKNFDLKYESYMETSDDLCHLSERIFAANLVFIDQTQIRLKSLKHPYENWRIGWRNFRSRVTHRTWLRWYKTYCDDSIRVPAFDRARVYFVFKFAREALRYVLNKLIRWLSRSARALFDLD